MKDGRRCLIYILFEAQQMSSADGKGQLLHFPVIDGNPINIFNPLEFFSFLCAATNGYNSKPFPLLYNEIALVPVHRINGLVWRIFFIRWWWWSCASMVWSLPLGLQRSKEDLSPSAETNGMWVLQKSRFDMQTPASSSNFWFPSPSNSFGWPDYK